VRGRRAAELTIKGRGQTTEQDWEERGYIGFIYRWGIG
jgi:hypothetical protein